MTRRTMALVVAVLALAIASVPAAEPWIHVRVVETGGDGETVKVNVPIELVRGILPLIKHEDFNAGKVRVELGDSDLSAADLRKIWETVRASRDANYVTVDGRDGKVRVAKRDREILVAVEGRGGRDEKVDIRLPLEVVDALFSGAADELDVRAAVEALARRGAGDIVTVRDDTSSVRIWIDGNESGE